MSKQRSVNRRAFLKGVFMGSVGLTMVGTPLWEAAADLLNNPKHRLINGIGLDDPELVQLAFNENPLGASPRAIEAVAKKLFAMNRYPVFDTRLEEAIAAHHGVPIEMVRSGAGSTEILIGTTLAAFYKQDGNVVTGLPSYPQVPTTAQMLEQKIKKVPVTADWRLDLEGMHQAIDKKTRMVALCNPNNPTGQVADPKRLVDFVRSVPKQVVVCLDEAYIHFVKDRSYPSLIPLTKEMDNLIVTRTFSKAYGLAGMRVGYGIGNPDLLQRMDAFVVGWLGKNTLSNVAAIAALEDEGHVRRTRRVVMEGKTYLYNQLEEMGFKPIHTETIFILADIHQNPQPLIKKLEQRKVKIVQAFDMDTFIRISVGLPRENEAFIAAFKEVMASG